MLGNMRFFSREELIRQEEMMMFSCPFVVVVVANVVAYVDPHHYAGC